MEWNELFDAGNRPYFEDIGAYIKTSKNNWDDLISHIEHVYKVKPIMEYSKCLMQPGWNIKYRKKGKALCTLYPMPDYFIVLVVIGNREANEVELAIGAGIFSDYVTKLYRNTPFSVMGRWLMIEVKKKDILDDIKELIKIKSC